MCRMFHSISFVLCLLVNLACHSAWAADWMAGTASANITPAEPMWMSGYGSRDKVSEGKLTDLWAKALVLKDSAGTAYVIVTLDLVGIDRETSLAIRQGVCQRHGIELANISLFSSHTHTGPVVASNQATDRIMKLYESLGFKVKILSAPRMISCTGDRTRANEMLAIKNLD